MSLINMNYSFATCSNCKRTIKMSVGVELHTLKCICEEKVIKKKERKTSLKKEVNV